MPARHTTRGRVLITRCSACSTEFRVTEAQLAARNGWVRCGRCMAVFDARRALVEPVADASASSGPVTNRPEEPTGDAISRAEPPDSPPYPGDAGSPKHYTDTLHESGPNLDISAGSGIDLLASSALEPDHESSHYVLGKDITPVESRTESRQVEEKPPFAGTETAPQPDALAESPPDPAEVTPPETAAVTEYGTDPADAAASGPEQVDATDAGGDHDGRPVPETGAVAAPSDEAGANSDAAFAHASAPADEAPPKANVSAVPSAPEDPDLLDFGPKRHKRRTALWVGGSAALLITLGAQAAFQYRGTIALLLPESKPYLEEFCTSLGCELPLPRRAELLSIETSDLQGHPNNPGVMVLAATLRNRAPFPQAYPALELTLTDDRDQPLARRVLQPADYLGPGASRPEGRVFAPSSEQPIRVFMEASALKATSYRLYLFHP